MRAIRFLAATLGCWAAIRVATIWTPADTIDHNVNGNRASAAANQEPPQRQIAQGVGAGVPPARLARSLPTAAATRRAVSKTRLFGSEPKTREPLSSTVVHIPEFENISIGEIPEARSGVFQLQYRVGLVPTETGERRVEPRFQVEGWALLRAKSSTASLLSGGQLGGSQVGVRGTGPELLAWKDWSVRPFGRLTSAIYAPRREEAALGLSARASNARSSVEMTVERRMALGREGRDAFAAYAAAGASGDVAPLKLDIAAYVQAGVVGMRDRNVFADGSATVHRVAASSGKWRAKLGAGLWGGAQPGVARLDAGPSAIAELKLGTFPFRLQLDWRFRAAGNAAPSSGPALTIAFAD